MLPETPLASIENRLRYLLPAEKYAAMWGNPSVDIMVDVHTHLRTLQRILHDYTSRQINIGALEPGKVQTEWQYGAMMFTDLAGFTKLMEANAAKGKIGAESILEELTKYFSAMISIISKSGGELVEFTGDAMLVVFAKRKDENDAVKRAVRAGLRMQRAMQAFAAPQSEPNAVSLKMRIGIHYGRFLTAEIGTPRRMEHVLLGKDVQKAKMTESHGRNERVNISQTAYEKVKDDFHFEDGDPDYRLAIDDFSAEDLGDYEIIPTGRRTASAALLNKLDKQEVLRQINGLLDSIEPLASYIPAPILSILIESAANRKIRPEFLNPTIMFINFVGLPEAADRALPGEERKLASSFSKAFSLINAIVEARGGILKKVTYHLSGSDIVIHFGAVNAHADDEARAAEAALAIRQTIEEIAAKAPTIGGVKPDIYCQIGINMGPAFAAEVGDPRGRREFNVLGDTVNTAARLMNYAQRNQIVVSESVRRAIKSKYKCVSLGEVALKGKSRLMNLYELKEKKATDD